jgi:hypothetical protein
MKEEEEGELVLMVGGKENYKGRRAGGDTGCGQ